MKTRTGNAAAEMTTGNPMKQILAFSVPMLGGMLFQQFYNLIDTLIVGQFLGVQALAGVGSTGSINFLVIGFVMGVCAGFGIPIAQRFGAGDYRGMRRFLANSCYLSVIFSAVMTVLVAALCRQILILMNTPSDILEYAYDYIFIIFLGIPATFLFNMTSSALRSIGNSRAPVLFLVFSSVINIGLDILLILAFHMGVAGAAAATVIAQSVSGVVCLIYMVRRVPILRIRTGEWNFSGRDAGILLGMGVPMGLQYSITAIGEVILQTSINSLGSVCVAGETAGQKVGMFFMVPYEAIGTTMATYGGQNIGAGRPERLDPGLKAASVIGLSYSAAALVLLYFTGGFFTGLFVSSGSTEVIRLGRQMLVINAAFYGLLHFVNGVRFLIQGMGYSGLAIIAGVCELAGRSVAGMLLVPLFGYTGACFANPIAWICADLFLFPAYWHLRDKACAQFGKMRRPQENAGTPEQLTG